MTLSNIQTLLATVDSGIRHYFSAGTGSAYSYWEETQRLNLPTDDSHQAHEGWRFYVHRFTKESGDATAAALFKALDEDAGIAVTWTIDFENDTGYIHHIFECEGY